MSNPTTTTPQTTPSNGKSAIPTVDVSAPAPVQTPTVDLRAAAIDALKAVGYSHDRAREIVDLDLEVQRAAKVDPRAAALATDADYVPGMKERGKIALANYARDLRDMSRDRAIARGIVRAKGARLS